MRKAERGRRKGRPRRNRAGESADRTGRLGRESSELRASRNREPSWLRRRHWSPAALESAARARRRRRSGSAAARWAGRGAGALGRALGGRPTEG